MNEMFSQGGKGSTGILTNKQAIARAYNVKVSEVIYSNDAIATLDGKKIIYDKPNQFTWYLPLGIPSGAKIVSVANGMLTYSPGNVTIMLIAPMPTNELVEDLASNNGMDFIGTLEGIPASAFVLDKILLDKIVPATDGTADCAASINQALLKYSGKGFTLWGNPNSEYLLQDTVSYVGCKNIGIEFNGAIVSDDVQGTIPTSGGRAKHTFLLYDCDRCKLSGYKYKQVATRSNSALTGGPNTSHIWVGGQYLGGAMTSNIWVGNISNLDDNACDQGFFLCGMGELDAITIENIELVGGTWKWGVNFEYGLAPSDPNVAPGMDNGRHPYNITVRHMRGIDIRACDGFLRVGGAYNAHFDQCTTYNVTNPIHYFSGDRGVTRFSQNVRYTQCKVKFGGNVITTAQYCMWMIVTDHDGSTGEALPSWTNLDHLVSVENCELWGNGVFGTCGIRMVSNTGKLVVTDTIIRNCFYGIWGQPVGRALTPSKGTVSVKDSVIKYCFQFIRMVDSPNAKFDHVTLKGRQQGSTSDTQVPAVVLSGDCSGTTFSDLLCTIPNSITTTNWFNIQSPGVFLERCQVETAGSTNYPVVSTYAVYGRDNRPLGTTTMIDSSALSYYRVIGDTCLAKAMPTSAVTQVDFDKGDSYLISGTVTINEILNGKPGDVVTFRGSTGSANATFTLNAVTGNTKIVPLSVTTETKTGNNWTKTFKNMGGSNGWWEI